MKEEYIFSLFWWWYNWFICNFSEKCHSCLSGEEGCTCDAQWDGYVSEVLSHDCMLCRMFVNRCNLSNCTYLYVSTVQLVSCLSVRCSTMHLSHVCHVQWDGRASEVLSHVCMPVACCHISHICMLVRCNLSHICLSGCSTVHLLKHVCLSGCIFYIFVNRCNLSHVCISVRCNLCYICLSGALRCTCLSVRVHFCHFCKSGQLVTCLYVGPL